MSSEIASRSSRFCDQEITENQRIHLRAQETIEGFFRPADNWFVVVERSIQHHRHSREIAKRRNQRVVPRIRFARDGLQPSGSSTCVGAGILPRFSARTEYASVMNGEGCDFSKYSAVDSAKIDGANGRKISLCLMRRLRISFIS